MLKASSISLIVATSISFSMCLPAVQAADTTGAKPKVAKDGDAKKNSAKEAKPAKDKDAKDSKDSKDSKDPKDSKTTDKDKDGKPDTKTDSKTDAKTDKADAKEEVEKEPVLTNVSNVSPDQLIDKPKDYLGKNIRFTADFAGFCTLALNYKPAYRPQKTHISFLVRKPDTKVPLSEMKLALPIPKETDKVKNKLLTSLKDGDKLEVTGKVFSTALEEPWIDVLAIKRLSEAKKPEGESSDSEEE